MAIDRTLVQGAFAANAPTGVPGLKPIQEATDSITKQATSYMLKRKAELEKEKLEREKSDAQLQQYIDQAANANDLGRQARELYTKQFINKADEFANASFEEKSKMLADIRFEAQDAKRAFEIYNILGNSQEKGSNINSHWLKNEGKAWLKAAVDPNINLGKNEQGVSGWEVVINGEKQFKTLDDFEREINKNLKDEGFAKGILAINENSKKMSAKNTDSKFVKFNKIETKNKINTLLNSDQANLISIATDPMLGSANSFIDHLRVGLIGKKYDSVLKSNYILDANNDGKIDEEEADNIISNLLKVNDKGELENATDLKAELSDYYTEIIERDGWNVGAGNRTITVNESDEYTKQAVLGLFNKIYLTNPSLALELKNLYPNYFQDDDELNIAVSKVG
jgi:hypothetical protein